jgi:hypothetical protein
MTEPTKVTVEEMDILASQIAEQRSRVAEVEEVLSQQKALLEDLKARGVGYLKELGRENFQAPDGTLYIADVWSITLPKTDQDKSAMLDWMKERGIYEKYVTVNASALKSLYMAEWEAAQAKGLGMEFQIPGVQEPKLYQDLRFRKK